MKQRFVVAILLQCSFFLFSQADDIALSSDGKLRHYSGENEDFFINNTYLSTVRVSDDSIVEKKYDERQRLIKEISWLSDSIDPVSIREYTYVGNESIAQRMTINDFSAMTRMTEMYNSEGLLIKAEQFSIEKSELQGITIDETKTMFQKSTNYVYDTMGRLIEQKTESVDGSEKTVFKFEDGGNKADSYFYSDNVLKKSIVYSSTLDWIETTFFPNNLYIQVFFEGNEAFKEVVFENDKQIRERTL